MRILVTGAGGFAGQHLIRHLRTVDPESVIDGTVYRSVPASSDHGVTYHRLDLRDADAVTKLIHDLQPDQIYHLAAQASVPRSFDDPWSTFEVNVHGQLNLLNAARSLENPPRILVASSAEVYGLVRPDDIPITEMTPLRPGNPYAVSKVAQDMLAFQAYQTHDLPVVRARAFNHIGPGQSEAYVTAAFAAQIIRIEAGQQEPVVRVGDLTAQRDFADVRDVCRAYTLLMAHGEAGEVYNIASGTAVTIQTLFDTLIRLSDVSHIEVQVDPARLRPSRVPVLRGDATHLAEATGWQPEISFEQSLMDVLADFRQRIMQQ